MAIICPDSAVEFLKSTDEYVLVGSCIQNSSIIVSKTGMPARRVGYAQNRPHIQSMVDKLYPEAVEKKALIMHALPYSLENGMVDTVLLDITTGLSLSGKKNNAKLENPIVTHVIVASKSFIEREDFKGFVELYNESVNELAKPKTFKRAFEDYKGAALSDKDYEFIKQANIEFVQIEP
ncbi:hypothetical protein SAMN02745945_02007 [Peptoclostridium litorale DSM 5388]|nr:putative membrane protein [Peptoclostridium litorale DSM 5388]SIO15008.1 hypothetical protein SAMN02745945_02007 [Peptoclostridium litorale DSM 5388]